MYAQSASFKFDWTLYLIDEVFPVFDQLQRLTVTVIIVGKSEHRACTPQIQFSQRFTNRYFALRALVQFLIW